MSITIKLTENDAILIKAALYESFIKNKMRHKNVQNTVEANYLRERISALLEESHGKLSE